MEFYCSECGRRESVKTRKAHCECGGLWKLDYKPPKFNISEIDSDEWSMFRYRKSGFRPPSLVNPAPAQLSSET